MAFLEISYYNLLLPLLYENLYLQYKKIIKVKNKSNTLLNEFCVESAAAKASEQ